MPIDEYWEMKRSPKDRTEHLSISGTYELYVTFLDNWYKTIE